MLPVAQARANILKTLTPVPAEQVSVREAMGRTLAEDVTARCTQPPVSVSAMDGYAVRAHDVENAPTILTVAGEAPAGGEYEGILGEGEAVRIFTGGPMPKGADSVVVQEDTERLSSSTVRVLLSPCAGKSIRPAGLDFSEGEVLLRGGRRLSVRDVALLAAMNIPWVMVRRRPRVAVLATGDEVVMPGEPLSTGQIVNSNSLGLAALVDTLGGRAQMLGIARDDANHLKQMAAAAQTADLIVTTGGVSVGDHDLVRTVLGQSGLNIHFWKIAMKPGKPLMFGMLRGTPFLGLPGNPVSMLVCGLVFLAPALAKLAGAEDGLFTQLGQAITARELTACGQREEYLRASLSLSSKDILPTANIFEQQDSAVLSTLAKADCFVVRSPHDPVVPAGDVVTILRFPNSPNGF